MSTCYLTSAYLAPIEYYSKLYNYDKVEIEAFDNYVKQTYRNRCFIGSVNEKLCLSLPIEKKSGEKCLTRDIRLSDHGNWRRVHSYAIESTYNNTPFYEYYEDYFIPFYEKKYDFLFDFNESLREMICDLLDMKPNVSFTSEYLPSEQLDGKDFREIIHPKKDYLLADPEYRDVNYYQVFEQKWGFRPNLSIIDLLFNMGPESILVLRDSMNK
ncbi:MAG: WbqC family protein [Bacteroidales bacterium]